MLDGCVELGLVDGCVVVRSGTVPGGTVVLLGVVFGVVVLPGCLVVLPGWVAPGNVDG